MLKAVDTANFDIAGLKPWGYFIECAFGLRASDVEQLYRHHEILINQHDKSQESGTKIRRIMSGRGFVDYSENGGHKTETRQE